MPHKIPASERRGGPGSSKDDATKPPPASDNPRAPYRSKQHSQVSGGGGEADVHHDHDPRHKRDFEAGDREKRQH